MPTVSRNSQKFSQALAAWQRGDLASTFSLLEGIKSSEALHLRGLAARRLGQLDLARQCLNEAARYDQKNAEIHHNHSLVEADLGDWDAALEAVQRAIDLEPGWTRAQKTLGRILVAFERWEDALTVYETVLQNSPGDQTAQYRRAICWLEVGQAENALHEFDRLLNAGLDEPACQFMRARAHQIVGNQQNARSDFETALSRQPDVLFLRETARQLYSMNEHAAFRKLLTSPFEDTALRHCAGELLRLAGEYALAEQLLGDSSNTTDATATLAWCALDEGNNPKALALAKQALDLNEKHARARAAAIVALCGSGRAEAAQAHVTFMRRQEPLGQHWVAYQLLIWRQLDDPRYAEWMDYERLVRTFELPTPDGYDSRAEFNSHLEKSLLALHDQRCHPIDQSLRDGSQTRRDLRLEPDATIRAYLNALDQPIRQYLKDIGTAPDHPLTRRNSGDYKFAGCWSVRLNGGGNHVSHVHPEGWISSAYYVSVPESDPATRSGWIQFGQPPYPTEPECPPELWVEPKPGRLVLFPSYLWHGTNPTQPGQMRLTAPFDISPATD